ncbi:MAG: hypothetical protein ACR2IE_10805 [Candidatus Sumerlaeaceae bacterium]
MTEPRARRVRVTRQHLLIGFATLLLLLLCFAFPIFAHWRSVAPGGSSGTLFLATMVLPLILFMPLVGLVSGIWILVEHRMDGKSWRLAFFKAGAMLAVSVLCTCLYGLGFGLSRNIRHNAFEHLTQRSKPLVNAIRAYETDHSRPPGKLEELVPTYLSEVPRPHTGVGDKYEYISGERALPYAGNPWVLLVDASMPLQFDYFCYYPLQNYPASNSAGWFERIADWAYLHE